MARTDGTDNSRISVTVTSAFRSVWRPYRGALEFLGDVLDAGSPRDVEVASSQATQPVADLVAASGSLDCIMGEVDR